VFWHKLDILYQSYLEDSRKIFSGTNCQVITQQKQYYISDHPETKEDLIIDDQNLTAKEHFVFTDPLGQLYHFSVEGNAIRDGTKLPAETSLSKKTIISILFCHKIISNSNEFTDVTKKLKLNFGL
jgi:hypothetical protein